MVVRVTDIERRRRRGREKEEGGRAVTAVTAVRIISETNKVFNQRFAPLLVLHQEKD